MVINVVLGNKFWSLWKRPMVLLTFLKIFRRCSSKNNLKSMVTLKCFSELVWDKVVLLKTRGGYFIFRLNINSWACLLASALKLIFCWKAQSLNFFRSPFSSFADTFISWVPKTKIHHQQIVQYYMMSCQINHWYK